MEIVKEANYCHQLQGLCLSDDLRGKSHELIDAVLGLLSFTPKLQRFDIVADEMASYESKFRIERLDQRTRKFVSAFEGTKCLKSSLMLNFSENCKIEEDKDF